MSVFKLVFLGFVMNGCFAMLSSLSNTPPHFKVCHQSDPHFIFKECIKASLNSIVKMLKNGSKELALNPLDPYEIPLLEVNEGTEGNVTFWTTFRHSTLLGLSNAQVISLNFPRNISLGTGTPLAEDKKLEFVTRWPHLDILGEYLSDVTVLTAYNLASEGNFAINMTDVTAIWIVRFNQVEIQGGQYLVLKDLDCDLSPSSVAYHIEDTDEGGNSLDADMDDFINENSYEIFAYIKPKIQKIFKEVFSEVATKIFARYPQDVLLPL